MVIISLLLALVPLMVPSECAPPPPCECDTVILSAHLNIDASDLQQQAKFLAEVAASVRINTNCLHLKIVGIRDIIEVVANTDVHLEAEDIIEAALKLKVNVGQSHFQKLVDFAKSHVGSVKVVALLDADKLELSVLAGVRELVALNIKVQLVVLSKAFSLLPPLVLEPLKNIITVTVTNYNALLSIKAKIVEQFCGSKSVRCSASLCEGECRDTAVGAVCSCPNGLVNSNDPRKCLDVLKCNVDKEFHYVYNLDKSTGSKTLSLIQQFVKRLFLLLNVDFEVSVLALPVNVNGKLQIKLNDDPEESSAHIGASVNTIFDPVAHVRAIVNLNASISGEKQKHITIFANAKLSSELVEDMKTLHARGAVVVVVNIGILDKETTDKIKNFATVISVPTPSHLTSVEHKLHKEQCRTSKCPTGYKLDALNNCVDINDCALVNGKRQDACAEICINRPSSYSCECTAEKVMDPEDKTQCITLPKCYKSKDLFAVFIGDFRLSTLRAISQFMLKVLARLEVKNQRGNIQLTSAVAAQADVFVQTFVKSASSIIPEAVVNILTKLNINLNLNAVVKQSAFATILNKHVALSARASVHLVIFVKTDADINLADIHLLNQVLQKFGITATYVNVGLRRYANPEVAELLVKYNIPLVRVDVVRNIEKATAAIYGEACVQLDATATADV